jgi:hypothetical protein
MENVFFVLTIALPGKIGDVGREDVHRIKCGKQEIALQIPVQNLGA